MLQQQMMMHRDAMVFHSRPMPPAPAIRGLARRAAVGPSARTGGKSMRLEAVNAVVSGGASGLGAATVRRLRTEGAAVTILDRDGAAAAALAAETGAHHAQADVTDDAAVGAGVAAAAAAMGGLNAAVNCAGIATAARLVGREGPHDPGLFRRTIDVNLTGTFSVMRHAAALMAREAPVDGERGVIVNTASIAAFDGQKGQTAYAASKGGIAGLTLPAARDLAGLGIRVCAIAPGVFRTPMVADLPQDVQTALAADIPFPRRLGDPAEFAALVAFILTCGYLNGAVIRLDGALRMR
jgi:NAD(P)-dependent dehydrogenase (short-subunit alcohol dehydrogenase family)